MKHLTPYSSVAGELPKMIANNVPEVFITWKEMLELKAYYEQKIQSLRIECLEKVVEETKR